MIFSHSVSFKDIVKQITENDFTSYKTIIIHGGRSKCLEVENKILRSTFSSNPSRVINYLNFNLNDLKKSVRSIYQTKIFLLTLKDNENSTKRALDVIEDVSGLHPIPRCLLLLNRNSGSREDMLRSGRKRQIIHLTILDVEEDEHLHKNFFSVQTFKHQRNIIIYYFDNFAGNYRII